MCLLSGYVCVCLVVILWLLDIIPSEMYDVVQELLYQLDYHHKCCHMYVYMFRVSSSCGILDGARGSVFLQNS